MSFEQVIFQPCDKIHFDKTINQEIDLIEHRQFMTDKEYKDLNRIFPKGKARLWGVVDGKKDSNFRKWQKIHIGDTVLFYNNFYHHRAIVKYCMVNEKLAEKIWNRDANNKVWKNIYFVDGLESCEISNKEMNQLCNYKELARPQGFRVLDEEKSALILDHFQFSSDPDGIIEGLSEYDGNEDERIDAALQNLGTSTNCKAVVTKRKEQSILRYWLFKKNKFAVCGICGRMLPVNLMEAAHIKKRCKCTDEERRNKNVVMPMCNMGCNDLYEYNYFKVEDGVIVADFDKPMTEDVKLYLERINGKECGYWNEKTKEFFDFHNKHC